MAHRFDGRRIALSVAVIVAMTAVLPPGAAYALARWRVYRAQVLADKAAVELAWRRDELRAAFSTATIGCGPGRLPLATDAGLGWVHSPVRVRTQFGESWPQDPWGRCYVLNVRAMLNGEGGLFLSAGPNGTIDTPVSATVPAADDIGTLAR